MGSPSSNPLLNGRTCLAICDVLNGRFGIVLLLAAILHSAMLHSAVLRADDNPVMPAGLRESLRATCSDCHNRELAEGSLNIVDLDWAFERPEIRDQWSLIHDRVARREMPPDSHDFPDDQRTELLAALNGAILRADRDDILRRGRGPLRRLNRDEYEQTLRDLLRLPHLDIRDRLPEDRESHLFNKTAAVLDMSRVQLHAYLDAADAALREAAVDTAMPPPVRKYRAVSTDLFPESYTFGELEAMFFALNDTAVVGEQLAKHKEDSALELALFRSAHWPYYGYPKGFVAELAGEYRVRFSARAVLQQPGYRLTTAAKPVPMTFRARKPSGPDVSGDVRATGGVMDVQPEPQIYTTTIRLKPGETFEYSLLGLPVPLARNVDGGPPTYRFPPFPEGGQPGVAFQWLEVEGPIAPAKWPPASHRVLFDQLGPDVTSSQPRKDAVRLIRRFIRRAALEPLPDATIERFEHLVLKRLELGVSLKESLLVGYQAFLCSPHVLYLREPERHGDQAAIAARLSYFLTNSRPDDALLRRAEMSELRKAEVLRSETDRLVAGPALPRFVKNFTDYWLNLRHIHRDPPDIRLYPEYRFDDYLIESMRSETLAFVELLFRENLPARSLVATDFVLANDRLSIHYGLPPLAGSKLRQVPLPEDSPLGGLLTQAAVLKVTANGTSTSPVLRGAWVMERLLGQPPPPPPASVPSVEPDIRGATTIRDLLAKHTSSPSCAACHARFDPVGFALENFDVCGGWRTRYRSLEGGTAVSGIDRAGHDFAYSVAGPIDSSGQLLDGQKFGDVRELRQILIDNERELARNLLYQLTVYATGTPVRFSDRPKIEHILDEAAADGYRVRDLLLALVQSTIFLGEAGCDS